MIGGGGAGATGWMTTGGTGRELVEQALAAMKGRGLFKPGTVKRVAIIGPGLDFADKDVGFDFYPQQTLQPFAILDSLTRLGLAPPPGSAEIVLLDNMSLDELREAVARRNRLAPDVSLEASGGVSLATIRDIALTGVERISVGKLTHGAVSLDVALDWLAD